MSAALADFRAAAQRLAAFGLGIQALEWIPRGAERPRRVRIENDRTGRRISASSRKSTASGAPSPREPIITRRLCHAAERQRSAFGFGLASNPRACGPGRARGLGRRHSAAGVKLVQNNAMGILLFVPRLRRERAERQCRQSTRQPQGPALGGFSAPGTTRRRAARERHYQPELLLVDETDRAAPTILASNSAGAPIDFVLSNEGLFRARATVGAEMISASPIATGPFGSRRRRPISPVMPTAAPITCFSAASC